MKLREDLALLRPTLLLATALLLAGLFAALFAHVRAADLRQEHEQVSARLRTAQARLGRIEVEAGEIRAATLLLQDLAARGILGEERRQAWLDQLRRIREARRLFDLQWELQASRPLETDSAAGEVGDVRVRASRLHIRMPLLHEEDLLHFLEDARGQVQAYVRPRRCAIAWAPPPNDPETTALQPRLLAECELDLITLALPEARPDSGRKP